MVQVSLILTPPQGFVLSDERIASYREALAQEADGFEIWVAEERPAESGPSRVLDGVRMVPHLGLGQTDVAVRGLQSASGQVLIVLDPSMGYEMLDLHAVAQTLLSQKAELVVASRLSTSAGWFRAAVGWIARRWTGTSDPLSGLIGLSRSAYQEASSRLQAVGSRFAIEIVTKVGKHCEDVPVAVDALSHRPRVDWSDLRHLKKLSDYRFGTLSRLVQFCAVGASGMVIDLAFYAALQPILFGVHWLSDHVVPPTKIPLALALSRLIAISVALVWNFLLNRRLTFSDARKGSIVRQFLMYALGNALSVFVSLSLSLGLPRRVAFFNDHKLLAALVGIAAGTAISFTTARLFVFKKAPPLVAGPTHRSNRLTAADSQSVGVAPCMER